MVVTQYYRTRKDGVRLVRSYSDTGMMLERDGCRYLEAIDPEDSGRVYIEVEDERKLSAEEALAVITGGDVC